MNQLSCFIIFYSGIVSVYTACIEVKYSFFCRFITDDLVFALVEHWPVKNFHSFRFYWVKIFLNIDRKLDDVPQEFFDTLDSWAAETVKIYICCTLENGKV